MCGIIAYTGNDDAINILLSNLRRLEYRGYDSAGIAYETEGSLWVKKVKGKVQALHDKLNADTPERDGLPESHCGIAHTRWATHGTPEARNAHPHTDASGDIAVVHNGIIENYQDIKHRLSAKGYTFESDTDSEVLAKLIGEYSDGDLLAAVTQALRRVKGTFGIAVISRRFPGTLIVARRGSPIVIGKGIGETIVASDPTAVITRTQQVIFLNDDDIAMITPEKIDIRDLRDVPVAREVSTLDWDPDLIEKGGYKHFMLKEIFEQPESLKDTIRGRLDLDNGTSLLSGLSLTSREIAAISRVLFMACGTSLYASMVGKNCMEALAHLPSEVEQAAEFRYKNPIISPHDLALAVSQSGETADTLAAAREAKRKGALIAGICNAVGSTIARETECGVYLHAGPEIGVASTKAFSAQVIVMLMMALKFGRCRHLTHPEGINLCTEIQQLPEMVKHVLDQNAAIRKLAERYAVYEHFFFLGRGFLYPVALEGALKLKEISYIHAEGYHASELKHGPIALLCDQTPVFAMLNDIPGVEKTISNVMECKARNAPVLGITTEGSKHCSKLNGHVEIPACSPYAVPIPTVVALQLFAYHVADLRGCEIDQPRNLAKSVTVE